MANFLPSGTMVAMSTPVDVDGRLDEAGIERLVHRVVSGGLDGISPTGSTGEGARLTREQRLAVCRQVRSLVPPGMPVIPGLPLVTLAEAPADLAALADAGATAALVAAPSYYPTGDEGALRLYETLADRSPLPLLLYNIPVYTKVSIAPNVVATLADHPMVAGIKDSSRDMVYQQQVLYATAGAEFSVLTGTDGLLVASLLLGAVGTIAASANLVPDLVARVYRTFQAGDTPAALTGQQRLTRIIAACRIGELPSGWKAALEIAGVCAAHPVPPGLPLPPADYDRLKDFLVAEGLANGDTRT
jgi:4-hydroxy-tetrahydrodipicolinate synthase